MQVTATEAKKCFESICEIAKTERVFIEKNGRIETVIMSAQHFESLMAKGLGCEQEKTTFESRYKKWISEQNTRFINSGLWCDDVRTW